jgi:hypothetical protein
MTDKDDILKAIHVLGKEIAWVQGKLSAMSSDDCCRHHDLKTDTKVIKELIKFNKENKKAE